MLDKNSVRHPHSFQAERDIISLILSGMPIKNGIIENLRVEYFVQQEHRLIISIIIELSKNNITPTVETVIEYMRIDKRYKHLLDTKSLGKYLHRVDIKGQDINQRVRCVFSYWAIREIIKKCYDLEKNNSNLPEETLNLCAKSVESLACQSDEMVKNTELVPCSEILKKTIAELERLIDEPTELTHVQTGFSQIDAMISGFRSGDMVLIGTPLLMARTDFALSLVTDAVFRQKKTACFFSFELPPEHVIQRLIATKTSVELAKMYSGKLTSTEFSRLYESVKECNTSKMQLADLACGTVLKIRESCKGFVVQNGDIDLIVVNYLQLMSDFNQLRDKDSSIDCEANSVLARLKDIAKEMDCAVIVMFVNDCDSQKHTVAGSIIPGCVYPHVLNSVADTIMLLRGTNEVSEDNESIDVTICKNKYGPINKSTLVWNKRLQSFK